MNYRLLILLLLCSIKIYGQDIEFYCNNKLYSIDLWMWTDPIQNCDDYRYDFYTDSVNFNEIPNNDKFIIDKTKESIIKRGGIDFYNILVLKYVIIAERPQKCDNRKYTLRYILPLDSVFYYRFSMTYDKDANLISDYQFPDYSSNKDIIKIIDYCKAIEIALSDSTFNKTYFNSTISRTRKNEKTGEQIKIELLPNIELVYDRINNIWTWHLYTETEFDGEVGDKSCLTGTWTGKKIIINAHNSDIMSVDDYKEYKSVTYGIVK